jgi:hypothetical protein
MEDPKPLSIELLKNDEQSIKAQINHLQGALAYNTQLQSFLEKKAKPEAIEPLPAPEGDQ